MKKTMFIVMLLSVVSFSFAQKKNGGEFFKKTELKAGVLSPIPANVSSAYKIDVGSVFFEAGYKLSKKVTINVNSGYMRFREGTENINNIPVLGGLKYNINENVYFGTSVGASFYDKDAAKKATLLHSPYVGLKMKHISMDLRYFNWRGRSNTENSLGVVVSYIL